MEIKYERKEISRINIIEIESKNQEFLAKLWDFITEYDPDNTEVRVK